MTTEVVSQVLSAGVQATFGQGRIWYVKSATAALTITAERKGTGANVRKFVNVGAGFKFRADEDDGWTYLRVTSAVTQTIELIIGDDDVDVANAVSVTGGVVISPSASYAAYADVSIGAGGSSVINASARRCLRIGSLSSNTNTLGLRVCTQGVPGARGVELTPGQWEKFDCAGAVEVYNPDTAAQTMWFAEET